MDYVGEIIALGIDSILFGICYRLYIKQRNAIEKVENAAVLELNSDMEEIIKTYPDQKLPYVAIRGKVKALGAPITSVNNLTVTGAIQQLSMKEHVVARNSAGYWFDHKRVIREFCNSVPFVLQESKTSVEVVDALRADILDLETISDCFQPSSPTLLDHVWGFISGVRHQGVQVTEKMLKEGAFITGVGELVSGKSEGGLLLQPPSNGSPFYLTVLPLSSLIRKLDDQRRVYRFLAFICGGVGLVIVGIMTRKWWRERTRKLKEQTRRQQASTQRETQQDVWRNEQTETQVCVVCCQNNRRIILLPCGHVCLCEGCSERITDICPVCRTEIETKAVAYIS